MGTAKLLLFNHFNDPDLLLSWTKETKEFHSVVSIPDERNGLKCNYNDSSSNDSIQASDDFVGRGAFDLL